MARYCPKCYAGIDADDVICPNCGEVLKPEAVKAAGAVPEDGPVKDDESGDVHTEELGGTKDESANQNEPAVIQTSGVQEERKAEERTPVQPPNAVKPVKKPEVHETAGAGNPNGKKKKEPPEAKVMSLGEWVVTVLLASIPIVNIIMLIIWSCTEETDPNKKNYARAKLIWVGVSILISLLCMGAIFAFVAQIFHGVYSPGYSEFYNF